MLHTWFVSSLQFITVISGCRYANYRKFSEILAALGNSATIINFREFTAVALYVYMILGMVLFINHMKLGYYKTPGRLPHYTLCYTR